MTTTYAALAGALPAGDPEEILRAFRQAYPLEEVQEELWRCLQPRLISNIKELDHDRADRLANLYEDLITLVQAVYRLPATPSEDTRHG